MATIHKCTSRLLINFNHSLIRSLCLKAAPKPKEVEEVRINVPWGHVAGKWWGPKTIRPIVAVHGWQDNAGSFDTIIPLLPDHMSYLAIDLPGHGLSSPFPDGMLYSITDSINLLGLIKRFYDWDKLSLMGHSMNSQANFLYCSLYTDICDLLISLELLKPIIRTPETVMTKMKYIYDKLGQDDERRRLNSSPPTYTQEELSKLIIEASTSSITPETAHYILARGSRPTEFDSTKFYVSRDSRVKYYNVTYFYPELINAMITHFKTPYLFIKASRSPYYEDKKHFDEALAAIKIGKKCYFEHHIVDGGHHVHLTHPELVSDIISNFINKIRPPSLSSSSSLSS